MAGLGPFHKPLRILQRQLPPLNFITLHYLYFLIVCMVSALIFWGASTPAKSVNFTDSLFLAISAMTGAGLNTVNLSTLNTFQQLLLFLLIMLGSPIWVSAFVVLVRRRAFERKFDDLIERRQSRRERSRMKSKIQPDREKDPDTAEIVSARSGAGDKSELHMAVRDDETVPQLHPKADYEDAGSQKRDLTPPERRGAPEMNGISSKTGRPLPRRRSSASESSAVVIDSLPDRRVQTGITFAGNTRFEPSQPLSSGPPRRRRSSIISMQGVGARAGPTIASGNISSTYLPVHRSQTTPFPAQAGSRRDIDKYFDSDGGWIARNSQFHGLTEEERAKLGGYEYRAVTLLAWLVPAYFFLWQLFGAIGCASWVALHRADTTLSNGINPWWTGAFNAISAFNNSGMSLLDANMTAFQDAYYLILTMSVLILAGNTCFPVFLRLIIWTMLQIVNRFPVVPNRKVHAKTLHFLLDHPRRCYTNLFPSRHTWWLLASIVALNGIDWAAFEILDIGNTALDDSLPLNLRVLAGLFQACSVRSGGFYIVAIPLLRISLQVLYVVMMYISAYPIVITIRNSNVYEERSLGIYADDPVPAESDQNLDTDLRSTSRSRSALVLSRAKTFSNHFVTGGADNGESNGHFVRQQLRAQLAHDLWWIVLAIILVMIIESSKFEQDPVVFSVFNFIFEIVSAYGCVGISVGVPWNAYSFCGTWQVLSKLILCAVMLRGRHRGLPVAIDKAVLLPGEEHGRAEEDDARIRLTRTISRVRQ